MCGDMGNTYAEGVPVRELCRRYTISPKTAYKWLARARQGDRGLAADQSPT